MEDKTRPGIGNRFEQRPNPGAAARRLALPAVALLPWGDLWEDYLDMVGISLDEFCNEMSGGYLFGYVEALELFGIRTVIVVWSREARGPYQRIHVPTGARVWVLPAARAHLGARRLMRTFKGSSPWTRSLQRAASLLADYSATTPRNLARVLRHEQCRAVLVQEYEYARFDVCVLLGRWLGLPVLATFQGGKRPEKRRSVQGWLRSRTVPAASGLLIGPQREAQSVATRYKLSSDSITAVPNPIDICEWRPDDRAAARATLGLPAEVPVACWHGRVEIGTKGLDILVDAWRMICSERPSVDLRLLLCGGGIDSAQLRRLIDDANLRGVHWRDEYVDDPLHPCVASTVDLTDIEQQRHSLELRHWELPQPVFVEERKLPVPCSRFVESRGQRND
jgi:glycosyltransferase involved in cell wall biosynthesis